MAVLGSIEKLVIFSAAVVVVIYATVEMRLWGSDLGNIFFRSGRWEEYIILMLIVFAFAFALSKLVQLTFRMQFRRR